MRPLSTSRPDRQIGRTGTAMSAVMKSLDTLAQPADQPEAAAATAAAPAQAPARQRAASRPAGVVLRQRLRSLAAVVLPPVLGMAFLVLIWQIVSVSSSGIPSPM